jgi:sarcosine oxidase subunit gamma
MCARWYAIRCFSIPQESGCVADIAIGEPTGFGLASVLPRRGAGAEALSAALGFAVAGGPVESRGPGLTLWGTGPNQWLAHAPIAGPDWAEALGRTLDGAAGVVDQSGAYILFTVTGADARRLLQKGLPIDLSPAAFGPDSVAVSAIAHIGVIVHQGVSGAYTLAVFRSFSDSLREWLDASIAAL